MVTELYIVMSTFIGLYDDDLQQTAFETTLSRQMYTGLNEVQFCTLTTAVKRSCSLYGSRDFLCNRELFTKKGSITTLGEVYLHVHRTEYNHQ